MGPQHDISAQLGIRILLSVALGVSFKFINLSNNPEPCNLHMTQVYRATVAYHDSVPPLSHTDKERVN
jgi:hypothetical protein